MRNLHELDRYRVALEGFPDMGDEAHGAFEVPLKRPPHPMTTLRVIASADPSIGWDHVSVSLSHRVPRYEEMEFIGDLFFLPGETWIQYRVAKSLHINLHPFVLHWWRPLLVEVPLPERWLV